MSKLRKSLFNRFTRRVLWYINIVMAIFLLLAYLSVFVSPDIFWPLAFFGLAFPYLVMVNIAFAVLWALRRKKYLLLPVITLIIGVGYMNRFVQIPTGDNQEKQNREPVFKIMTYNVRMFDYYRWSDETEAANKMIEFFRREQPDILCLQEFYIPKDDSWMSLGFLESSLPWLKYRHIDYINNFMGGMYGVATFSRYPIIRKGSQSFDNSVNRVIFTDMVIGNDTVRVFNNHLQSFRLGRNNVEFLTNIKLEPSDEQIQEAKDLSKKLKNAYVVRSLQADLVSKLIETSSFPVLVCGDFNDTPVSYTYKTMLGDLKDSFITSGSGISTTYHGSTPNFRIDYILYSDSLVASDYRRHTVKYSDHYPISTVIHLD